MVRGETVGGEPEACPARGIEMTKKIADQIAAQTNAHNETTAMEEKSPVPMEVEPRDAFESGTRARFEVFVDCLPVHGSSALPVLFETIMEPLAAQVAREGAVMDLRFLKYGEGKARLAVLLREELAANRMPSVIAVDSRSSYSDVFLECVTPRAAMLVRALRA